MNLMRLARALCVCFGSKLCVHLEPNMLWVTLGVWSGREFKAIQGYQQALVRITFKLLLSKKSLSILTTNHLWGMHWTGVGPL